MIPLLCVAARYGSTVAKSGRDDDAVANLLPRVIGSAQCVYGNLTLRSRQCPIRQVRENPEEDLPPVIDSISGATPSHMPLVRFAPMASRVSTKR